MSLFEEILAGRGDIPIIETVEMSCHAWPESRYYVKGYEDLNIYVPEEGRWVIFEASAMVPSLPTRDNRGNQVVNVLFDNVKGDADKLIKLARSANQKITLSHRIYLGNDLSTPVSPTLQADVKAASLVGTQLKVQAGFFPVYDTNFNRITYNSRTARAIKYVS